MWKPKMSHNFQKEFFIISAQTWPLSSSVPAVLSTLVVMQWMVI